MFIEKAFAEKYRFAFGARLFLAIK